MALTKKQNAIVSRWVKALRSGKYKQGKEKLRKKAKDGDRYCCLGVLCEMAVRAKVISGPTDVQIIGDAYSYAGAEGTLPPAVRKWAGLKGNCGCYNGGSLAELNDDGTKFDTIAEIIESKPKGLFV